MCKTYPIQYEYSLIEESPILFRSDGYVVEEAESQRLIMLCVVTRRADKGDTITKNASTNCNDMRCKPFYISLQMVLSRPTRRRGSCILSIL